MAEGKKQLIVIGAGLPRTGTNSLSLALPQILNRKCYHMADVFKNGKSDAEFWIDMILNGKTKAKKEFDEFFLERGYNACVDYPASIFYKYIKVS